MRSTVDLRDHFGIWERCGNTRFFRKDPDNPWRIVYLNPLDGILVILRKTSLAPHVSADEPILPWRQPKEEPHYELIVKNASRAREGAVEEVHRRTQPWVKRAVQDFFRFQMMGWAAEAILEHHGKPTPGDPDIRHMLKIYRPGGQRYLREGRSPEGDEPFLEEMLEAVFRTVGQLESATVDYGRNLSQADAAEALAELGILEC